MQKTSISLAVLFGLMTPTLAQDPLKVSECSYVTWMVHDEGSSYDEWLCPEGVKFVYAKKLFEPDAIIKGEPGDGRCTYEEKEKAWLCPPGFRILPRDATKVAVPN